VNGIEQPTVVLRVDASLNVQKRAADNGFSDALRDGAT